MSVFFPVKIEDFETKITIPKFQNNGKLSSNLKLFSASIQNNEWVIENQESETDANFFIINDTHIKKQVFFFLENEKNIFTLNPKEFNLFNPFTITHPAFRCNLKLENKSGGFSSYQSEYPFSMMQKKGNIVSSLFSLTNKKKASNNYLLFNNIYFKPIIENINLYVVDIKKKLVLKTFELKTNTANVIKLDSNLIGTNNYIFSDPYLGVPSYLSEENGNLSFEHTHPPHEYIQSQDRFRTVAEFKNIVNEIIFKKNI